MTLLEEIQAKCSAELIAAQEHGQIAALVSAGRTKVVKVPIADMQAYLQTQGVWWAIKSAAADPAHAAVAAAVAVIDVANARYENIDTTLPMVAQMLGALVTAAILTQAQMDALTALGVVPDPVSASDVITALKG